jgi:peroxiredoxin
VLAAAAAVVIAAAVPQAQAQAALPRKADEFTVTRPAGDPILLSSFKGKVVVVEFLFLASPHCIQLTQMLNRLQTDLGSRGYESVAVAFGQGADQGNVNHFAQRLGLTYPFGYATSGEVDAFLGRHGAERLKIPQMIVIDRKGVIRAATGTGTDPRLENETALRTLVTSLLDQRQPPKHSGK